MNVREIERILRNTKCFDGVFSVDTLPAKPRLLVCNLKLSHLPGDHWICIWVDENRETGEYFDSLGRSPANETLNSASSDTKHRQRVLWTVEHYCVMYCMLRSRNVTMNNFVSCFINETTFNDYYMHALVCINESKLPCLVTRLLDCLNKSLKMSTLCCLFVTVIYSDVQK